MHFPIIQHRGEISKPSILHPFLLINMLFPHEHTVGHIRSYIDRNDRAMSVLILRANQFG